MKDQLEQRLAELRAELARGERMEKQLRQQLGQLQITMERIRGAIIEFELLLAPPDELPPDEE